MPLDPYPLLTPDERAALDHVREVERGPYAARGHRMEACPPMTRGMCMHMRPLDSAYQKYPELEPK